MLDAFHVVKLATAVVDDVRRRVQQETAAKSQITATVSAMSPRRTSILGFDGSPLAEAGKKAVSAKVCPRG